MRSLLIVGFAVLLSGCYHATVDTGLAPSGEVVEEGWAHGFLYGLVPPSAVETAAECDGGVAKVETQLSFLNQVVRVLTGGIYTPMTIEVQCAQPGVALAPGSTVVASSRADLEQSLSRAAEWSAMEGEPVLVTFQAAK